MKFHAHTDVGLKRTHNEDSLLAAESSGLFVVTDGVGGRKAGELASAITVHTFQKYAANLKDAVEAFALDNQSSTRNEVLTLLHTAANAASRRVYETAQDTGRQGMTTTLVAMVVGGGAAFVVHVGDSRAYLLRNHELKQLTEDHSMLNQLLQQGSISLEDAKKSRYQHVITRAIGLYPTVQTDTLFVELIEGDRLMLCSDGLSDLVRPDVLKEHMSIANLPEAVDKLIQAALNNGGNDNITAILVEPDSVLEAEAVNARAQVLSDLFLFNDLPFHARLRVGRIINERFVSPGQRIVSRGEAGDTLYIIVQGSMSVVVDGTEIAVLEAGEHFGELALTANQPRSADVIAKGFGHLLTIGRDTLREFTMMEPTLGNQILWKLIATLGERLRSTNEQIHKD